MTLDEASKHAEEVAEENEREAQKLKKSKLDWKHHEANLCKECAEEHKQLADWLKDYKRLKKQKPCEDTISRQAVFDQMYEWMNTCEYRKVNATDYFINRINKLPPVNPQPKTGHWIRELIRNEKGGCIGAKRICSKCNNDNKHDEYMHYCPNCGAKMIEPQESEDH